MNKQTAAYLYNGILFRNRKEWTPDPYNNRDESETQFQSERNQNQKATYCKISSIRHYWKGNLKG